jgi:hypothetical protein
MSQLSHHDEQQFPFVYTCCVKIVAVFFFLLTFNYCGVCDYFLVEGFFFGAVDESKSGKSD